MEVTRLSNEMKYVEINGVTLNLEERSRIDLSCMQLSADINQGKIYFWGKIRGKSTHTDYCDMKHLSPSTQHMRNCYKTEFKTYRRVVISITPPYIDHLTLLHFFTQAQQWTTSSCSP